MSQPELQCAFCEQTSSRPQGLAAHVRSRHPREYPRWLKTPTRFANAKNGSLAPKAAQSGPPAGLQETIGDSRVPSLAEVQANTKADPLKRAQTTLRCAFCEQTFSRSQGLAAHIRSRHPKQYQKWLKTPTRLADAKNDSVAPAANRPEPPAELQEPMGEVRVSSYAEVHVNPALDLLKQAHSQLIERKQGIEAELARLSGLTKDLEAVNSQIQALDKALGAFESAPVS
jgi:hypothetical protein